MNDPDVPAHQRKSQCLSQVWVFSLLWLLAVFLTVHAWRLWSHPQLTMESYMKGEAADTRTGSAFQDDQVDEEKEPALSLPLPGWPLSGGLAAEFLSKGSPSWPRLAWESIFKCRDLDLNGLLKQSQENKSKGCFSGAEWGAASSHSLSLKNSFALRRMNSSSVCV